MIAPMTQLLDLLIGQMPLAIGFTVDDLQGGKLILVVLDELPEVAGHLIGTLQCLGIPARKQN